MHSYHSLGRVLRDVDFRFPPLIESIPWVGEWDVSAERLLRTSMPDFVFATSRGDTGGKPRDELAAMEKSCRDGVSLTACRSGRYVPYFSVKRHF